MPETRSLLRQFIDGKFSLGEQENTLNFLEQVSLSKVISYAKASGTPKANEAVLDGVQGRQPPRLLLFLDGLKTSEEIIIEQLAQGRNVVFHDKVFVDSTEGTVLGFR